MLEALAQVTSPGTLNVIKKTMDNIKIVWEQIDLAKEKYPMQADLIDSMFMEFQLQAEAMGKLDYRVFESHVKEILERVSKQVNKEELEIGTKAEVLTAIVRCSFAAPLNYDATLLYSTLFRDIIGERAFIDLLGEEFLRAESHPGAVDEMYGWAQRKLKIERRPNAKAEKQKAKLERDNARPIKMEEDARPRENQTSLPGFTGRSLDRITTHNNPSGILVGT